MLPALKLKLSKMAIIITLLSIEIVALPHYQYWQYTTAFTGIINNGAKTRDITNSDKSVITSIIINGRAGGGGGVANAFINTVNIVFPISITNNGNNTKACIVIINSGNNTNAIARNDNTNVFIAIIKNATNTNAIINNDNSVISS